MTTLEHAFNAKDMNSLILKIIRGQVRLSEEIKVSLLILLIGLDSSNSKTVQRSASLADQSYAEQES